MNPFEDIFEPNYNWFRLTRLGQHLSQEQIGDRAGYSRAYISRFENGMDVPLEFAIRYAQELGFEVTINVKKR